MGAVKTERQKALHREAEKRRRERSPERVKAQLARFRSSEKYKKWCIWYRQKANEASLRYWHKNRDKIKKYQAVYSRTDKGRLVKVVCTQKRTRAKMLRYIPYTTSMLHRRLQRLGKKCVYCSRSRETIDHLIPLSGQGYNCLENLVPACVSCNSSKGALHPIVWMKRVGFSKSKINRIVRLIAAYEKRVHEWETA